MSKKKEEKITCVDCGTPLEAKDEGKLWGRCMYCGKPVCFGCSKYLGVYKKGLYLDNYVEVLRLCGKCYGKEKH
ncbi:hypothetical protein DRO51_04100 [Candidatus Bathyarchaeota archaeon]|nr:MAG: hypothetical protein DRO51_04100 [Candidatus Bathyarchaeota archaeon]